MMSFPRLIPAFALAVSLHGTLAFVVHPTATRIPWKTQLRANWRLSRPLAIATPSSYDHGVDTTTSLASSVEASAFIMTENDVLAEVAGDAIAYPAYLQEKEIYDLSDSIVGNGISLERPSLNFARILVLAASAVYGTNFAVVKMLDEQMPFAVSATMRFGLAAAVVSALVLQGESGEDKERGPATWAGMEIGGWYCLAYLCQAVGLQTADASKSAFFNALAVIVVPLLDSFLRGKQMGMKGISSVALAILGVGLLQLGPSIVDGVPLAFTAGDAFCLGQAALFGIGYWRLESVSSQHSTQAGRITMGQLLGVALGSTVFCGLTADLPTVTQLQGWLTDPFTAGALAWTALVSTALALYLETVALKAVSAAELTVLMTSVSLFGSAFAFVTMDETMSSIGMLGGLLILAGCVFSSSSAEETATVEDEIVEAFEEQWLVEPFEAEERQYFTPTPTFSNSTGTVGLYQ